MRGKFVSNSQNPYSNDALMMPPEELRELRKLVSGFVVGPPQATDAYTVEELEAAGLIGLYESPFKEC